MSRLYRYQHRAAREAASVLRGSTQLPPSIERLQSPMALLNAQEPTRSEQQDPARSLQDQQHNACVSNRLYNPGCTHRGRRHYMQTKIRCIHTPQETNEPLEKLCAHVPQSHLWASMSPCFWETTGLGSSPIKVIVCMCMNSVSKGVLCVNRYLLVITESCK